MYEEQGSFFEEDYNSHVERFEEMLKNNESYFFDVDVFEYLAEHYLEDGNIQLALKALEIGIIQHPSSAIIIIRKAQLHACLLYTSPSPRDKRQSRMPSSA